MRWVILMAMLGLGTATCVPGLRFCDSSPCCSNTKCYHMICPISQCQMDGMACNSTECCSSNCVEGLCVPPSCGLPGAFCEANAACCGYLKCSKNKQCVPKVPAELQSLTAIVDHRFVTINWLGSVQDCGPLSSWLVHVNGTFLYALPSHYDRANITNLEPGSTYVITVSLSCIEPALSTLPLTYVARTLPECSPVEHCEGMLTCLQSQSQSRCSSCAPGFTVDDSDVASRCVGTSRVSNFIVILVCVVAVGSILVILVIWRKYRAQKGDAFFRVQSESVDP